MFSKISNYITDLIYDTLPDVQPERREIIEYGVYMTVSEIVKISLIIIVSIILHIFPYVFGVIAVFGVQRTFLGGTLEFAVDKPYILGAIFRIISKVLAVDEIPALDKLTRLADFESKGYIIAEVLCPGNGDKFREQLRRNADKQNEEAVSNNDAARIVIMVIHDLVRDDGEITIYPKDLFSKCEPYIKGKNFPKDETRLIKELNKIRSNLESERVYFRKEEKDRHGIPYTFSTIPFLRIDKTKT